MSRSSNTLPPTPRVFLQSPRDLLGDLPAAAGVIALVWFGADSLHHLKLSVVGFLSVFAAFTCAAGLGGVLERRSKRFKLAAFLAGAALPFPLVLSFNAELHAPMATGAIAWITVLCGVSRLLWRNWPRPTGESLLAENARRLLLIAASTWAMFSFYTDVFMGGVDARWYVNMLRDFVEQFRHGVFPVFLGQGENAYNGAVHPFRSAPLHLWVGGILDLVTLRSLSIFSLQHLAAIVGSLGGVIGMYSCLNYVRPGKRWFAAVGASGYALLPACLSPLYMNDMYMTGVATAVLPLVYLGNVRAIEERTAGGQLLLAAGLALVWMAHPPTALLATIATVAIQAVAFAVSSESLLHALRPAIALGGAFGALSCFYFFSMSDVPAPASSALPSALLWLGGLALLVVGVARACFTRRWSWTALAAIGAALAARPAAVWLTWGVVFSIVLFVGSSWQRRDPKHRDSPCARVTLLFLSGVVAALLTLPIATALGRAPDSPAMVEFGVVTPLRWNFFLPLDAHPVQASNVQPGALGWLLLFSALLVLRRAAASRLIVAWISLLTIFATIPLGALSRFIDGYAPIGFVAVLNLPLSIRLMPNAVAAAVAAGVLTLVAIENARGRQFAFALLVLGVSWSAWEARRFSSDHGRFMLTRRDSLRSLYSESSPLSRYAYDLLPYPSNLAWGKTDPRLHVRLLDVAQRVKLGPDEIAKLMETKGAETQTWTSRQHPTSPNWFLIEPLVPVTPGEERLLRFEFDPAIVYDGFFVITTPEHDYREYALPSDGERHAFGTLAESSKVMSLWTSGKTPTAWEFTLSPAAGCNLTKEPATFAKVILSRYEPELSPIRVDGWLPFRARVNADEAGFLETPRVFIPGYKARVDGRDVKVQKSLDQLAMIPVGPGTHHVELRYAGTFKLWTGAVVSLVGWLALLAFSLRRKRDTDKMDQDAPPATPAPMQEPASVR